MLSRGGASRDAQTEAAFDPIPSEHRDMMYAA
jgi:hypothetical protein